MGWYRVKFPRNIIQLCHHARTSHQQRHNKFIFRIPPHMGKTELKNILTSLYDLQVKKINTANYDGLIKRSAGNVYKDKDYKRAVVTLIPKFEGDTMGWPENYT